MCIDGDAGEAYWGDAILYGDDGEGGVVSNLGEFGCDPMLLGGDRGRDL